MDKKTGTDTFHIPEQLFLSDNLRFVVNDIPPYFVSKKSAEALLGFCSSFPILISRDVGIEIKLSPADTNVDLAFSVEKNSAGCEILLNEAAKYESNGIEGWDIVKNVLQRWTSVELYNTIIKRIWLEFDHNDSGYNPVPSLFIEFEEGISARNYKDYSLFIKNCLSQIPNIFNIPDLHPGSLQNSLQAFDYNSPVYETGVMLSRKNAGLRIVFADFGIPSLKELLKNAGFTGNTDSAFKLYSKVKGLFDYLILHINLNKNTGYFAIECYFNNKSPLNEEPRWMDAINYLTSYFDIDKDKFTELLMYPGVIYTEPSYPFTIIKRFNHIKFILKENSDVEVKAYPGMRADYKY